MLNSVTETKNAPYLDQEAKNQKNKGTLLSATLKVGENKVPLFFCNFGLWAEIWALF